MKYRITKEEQAYTIDDFELKEFVENDMRDAEAHGEDVIEILLSYINDDGTLMRILENENYSVQRVDNTEYLTSFEREILNGINDYFKREEFDSDVFDEPLEYIGLMYTTDGDDEEYEVSCAIDFKHRQYIRRYGDKIVRDDETLHGLYHDFCGQYPVSWDALYSWTMELANNEE